jgi:MFS family permease
LKAALSEEKAEMALKILSKDGFYGWVNLSVMFFFNVVVMLMMAAFSLFLPFWVDEFDWSRASISGAQTVSIILAGLTAPMVAVFIMKQGPKRAIVLGNFINVIGLVLLSYQSLLWHLYLGNGVIIGLGMSIGGILAGSTVINNWFILKRPAALSISMAAMGFSGVVANPSLMALINSVGWRNTYLILAAAAFLFCVVAPALFLRNKPEDLGQVPDGPVLRKPEEVKSAASLYRDLDKTTVDFTAQEAFHTPSLWLLVAYTALTFLVLGGLMVHQVAFLFDLGISRMKAATALGVMSAVMGISQLGIGFLGLRFKMHSLAVVSIILSIVGFASLLFAHSLPQVLVFCVLFGMGCGIQSVAASNLMPDYYGRTEFPKIMGFTSPITTFIMSAGAPFTGYIRDVSGSYIPAFRILLVLLVVSFFCIVLAKRPLHPSLKQSPA